MQARGNLNMLTVFVVSTKVLHLNTVKQTMTAVLLYIHCCKEALLLQNEQDSNMQILEEYHSKNNIVEKHEMQRVCLWYSEHY